MSSIKMIDEPRAKNPFAFSKSFTKEFECAMKVYDKTFDEFRKVTSSKTVDIEDEYGVCNNAYKLRFITPTNISSYMSYVMKALKNQLILPNIGDMEKFAVANVKQFMTENGCVPIEDSSIFGTCGYVSDEMTLQEMLVLCENDVYQTSVCSKFDMTQRKASMKQDVDKIINMHFSANMKKIVNALPGLFEKTDYSDLDFTVRKLIDVYVETFILFAVMLNCVTMSNMILYCVPKSTFNTKLITKTKSDIKFNSLVDGDYDDSESMTITECCLLKTNNMMLTNKIPFNINMRDIVLQDVHPHFKDTESALHFITTDTRSPISVLLVKYSDENSIRYTSPEVVMNLFTHDMRCALDPNRDNLEEQYKRVDFHTDVNWLDKIAYGNNYLNGNYRADSMGNHHFDPMRNSIDTLYRMFGDCALCSSEELANHILTLNKLMLDIIHMYKECRIQNWELVRDVLAVLGEIMTRCMIKLYNNHMCVFVASDDMNDTEIPGYMYTESFIMEADDNKSEKPKVEVNTGATGFKKVAQKVQTTLTQIIHKFITWIHNVLAQAPLKFNENHKAEMEYVYKNTRLNREIYESIEGKTFAPTVTNFPNFKLQGNVIMNLSVKNAVDSILANLSQPINQQDFNKKIYPEKVVNKINATIKTESYVIEADTNNNAKNDSTAQESKWLVNFILYDDPDHQPSNQTTQLHEDQWQTLIKDLTEIGPDLGKMVKHMEDDLSAACTDIEKRTKELEDKLKSGNDNQASTNEQNDGGNNDLQTQYNNCSQLLTMVQHVADVYHRNVIDSIQKTFYATSYTLYRDIVIAYQQQKHTNNTQQTKTESYVDAVDGLRDIII